MDMAVHRRSEREWCNPGVEDALTAFEANAVENGGPDFGPGRFRHSMQWQTHHSNPRMRRQVSSRIPEDCLFLRRLCFVLFLRRLCLVEIYSLVCLGLAGRTLELHPGKALRLPSR